ncbi:hypothetical protein EXT66_06145 [Pectobacterium carotovorum subsp. carotovorum]|nr:hypothetical protein [Pectobacterium carotovorum]MCL6333403.1 hypothetical protein [Pectobacterium carotovorum subsp. carotovorum]MCL6345377.1 hypothetical protein [Pectobacterium carotovorum subsp. carotovorum]MCL6400862.1 hypothetical protein [Pectobacterium carotovorum subsp. carotovorum]
MFRGYPDFQQVITDDKLRATAAYQQPDVYYLYPEPFALIAGDPLAFALDVILSQSSNIIYGDLNFTTELQFASSETLEAFNRQHPGKALQGLPIIPYKLGFHSPSGHDSALTHQDYDPNWYSALSIQFLISLDADTTQLMKKTLLDNIIGFNARLDGFVEGVSPRLNYTLECDLGQLIAKLAATVKDAKPVSDNRIAFPYVQLTQYVYENLSQLPLLISPAFTSTDPAETLLFAQALLDRLFNTLGSPYIGNANTNMAYICLLLPQEPRRLMVDLKRVELTRRPICFLLDPFAAAQQVAKEAPEQIIHQTTAPSLPDGTLSIDLLYAFPQGLNNGVFIDIQVILPPGELYPFEQQKTQRLIPNQSYLTFTFINNTFSTNGKYQYHIRVSYPTDKGYISLVTEPQISNNKILTLDYSSFPCQFLTINIDPTFAQHSMFRGNYYSANLSETFELTLASPCFSYPITGSNAHARVTAWDNDSTASVVLDMPIIQSATLGVYSFPQFGAQHATITTQFAAGIRYATLSFQAQGETQTREHTFTPQDNCYEYQWNVTSIYAAGFRYKTSNGQWSNYVTSNQTIMLEAENED